MFALLSLVLSAAPQLPIQVADRIEPIGWSADHRTLALRVFFGGTFGEAEACPGYVDASGKPFGTGLAIVVVRDGAVQHSFEIQASPMNAHCTPLAEAKRALDAAKKKLDELGIDRAAPGTVLSVTMEKGKAKARTKGEAVVSTWNETWLARNGEQAPLEVTATMTDAFSEEVFHTVSASFVWKLRTQTAERTGTLKLGPFDWSLNLAGGFAWKLTAFESPNQESVVAFITQSFSNMRGASAVTTLLPLEGKR